jgi:hypothetical protein
METERTVKTIENSPQQAAENLRLRRGFFIIYNRSLTHAKTAGGTLAVQL